MNAEIKDDEIEETPHDITSSSEYISAWLDLIRIATEQLDGISTVRTFWNQKTRPDGRFWTQTRPVAIQHGILTTAAGSALVQISSRQSSTAVVVLASVTIQVGQPSTIAPKQGDVMVTVQTSESSSSSIVLQYQSYLQRILEENVDLEQLVIVEGKAAYRLNVHVQILLQAGNSGNGGNVFDACVMAVTAALLDTHIPAWSSSSLVSNSNVANTNTNTNTGGGEIVAQKASHQKDSVPNTKKKLQMNIIPISLTAIGVLVDADENDANNNNNNNPHPFVWIVDPDGQEAFAMNDQNDHAIAHATVVVNAAQPLQILNLKLTTMNNNNNNNTNEHDSSRLPSQVSTSELASFMILGSKHAEKLFPILTPTNNHERESDG